MNQISVKQFQEAVKSDPGWAAKLTEPLGVVGYCNMQDSEITHLSPFLHFSSGREDPKIEVAGGANFSGCKNLKVAEGRFHESVNFSNSGVEEIGDLEVDRDEDGWAASFCECFELRTASGTFRGFVSFEASGITKISSSLKVTGRDQRDGDAATFARCKALKVAEGDFASYADFSESGIEKIGDLRIQAAESNGYGASFHNCVNLKILRGKFPGYVEAYGAGIKDTGDLEITDPTPVTGLYCNLFGTPMSKRDLLKTMGMMTKSQNPKVWKTIREALVKGGWKEDRMESMDLAIRMLRRSLIAAKVGPKAGRLEI
jgi:hypothetical protein